jgi:hypothetical protein
MALFDAIRAATALHKRTAKDYIYSSEGELTITIVPEDLPVLSSGSSMFADLSESQEDESIGPFKCIWVDADSARAGENTREARIANRWITCDAIAKLWLEDILVVDGKPYGETYLDRAKNIVHSSGVYQILGYDRYGMGTTDPYIIAVAVKGSWANEQE